MSTLEPRMEPSDKNIDRFEDVDLNESHSKCSNTHEVFARYLYETFRPVRLTIRTHICYVNDIFVCQTIDDCLVFTNNCIEIPVNYMAEILDNTRTKHTRFKMPRDPNTGLYVLDTEGKIPAK